jgi:uncharacterized ParB-like nuclease family protein
MMNWDIDILNHKVISSNGIYSDDTIINDVMAIHRNPDDFDDGDLSSRISKYAPYELQEIAIDNLNLDEWEVRDDLVDDMKNQYESNHDYPPIVVGIDRNGIYTIIDGIHRANALDQLGIQTIKAYVGKGKKKKSDMVDILNRKAGKTYTFYHGSAYEFDAFDLSKQQITNEYYGRAISVSLDKQYAMQYVFNDDGNIRYNLNNPIRNIGYLYTITIDKPMFNMISMSKHDVDIVNRKARKFEYSEALDMYDTQTVENGMDLMEKLQDHFGDSTNDVLRELGFAGIIISNKEARVFNPSDINIIRVEKIINNNNNNRIASNNLGYDELQEAMIDLWGNQLYLNYDYLPSGAGNIETVKEDIHEYLTGDQHTRDVLMDKFANGGRDLSLTVELVDSILHSCEREITEPMVIYKYPFFGHRDTKRPRGWISTTTIKDQYKGQYDTTDIPHEFMEQVWELPIGTRVIYAGGIADSDEIIINVDQLPH